MTGRKGFLVWRLLVWTGWVALLVTLGNLLALQRPHLGVHTEAAQVTPSAWVPRDLFSSAESTGPTDPADLMAVEQAKSLSRAFRYAAQRVLPTVVKIRTVTRPQRGNLNEPPLFPWRDLFPESEDLVPPPQAGLGSGVIIHPSGIVLTNRHVLENSQEVIVQLANGRELTAVDVKSDDETDLAVVRIEPPEPLPAASLGDSDQLDIGDWVIAIGHPFELEQTVSAGIISAKGRTLGAVRRARFLQTDAAINPGNSGGPLVNLQGEVVGINTAIFSRTGGNQGIGFAIPINLAKWIVPQLLETGRVARAYLGIELLELTSEAAKRLSLEVNQGVLVGRVFPNSPAEVAGLRRNDLIVSYDGRSIRSPADLQELVERSPADSEHKLEIIRDGKAQELTVIVRAMPEDFGARAMTPPGMSSFYQNRRWGFIVVDLTEEMARRLGLSATSGVLVIHVDSGRPAARSGLREGMIIRKIGEKTVENVVEFREALTQWGQDKPVPLTVETRDGIREITITSP